jgi:hypothetical protein
MKKKLNRLKKRLNLLNLKKEANLVSRISKEATDVFSEDSDMDHEIAFIEAVQDSDEIITLSADSATIVSRNIDKVGLLLFEILGQLTDHPNLYKDTVDPRLASLINGLEEANEMLHNAGMQANHLRDGTGD